MIPFLPLLLLSGGGWLGVREYKKRKALTPARQAVLENALNADPPWPVEKLLALAAAFEKEGLAAQGKMLRQRAALYAAPQAVKDARRAVFMKAINSKDPDAILQVARAHEEIGAVGAAQALRLQAETLKAVKDA